MMVRCAVNKYERDAIRDVVTGILRDHINKVGASIDTYQMRLVIEKGYADRTHPFPAKDPSRSEEFIEEIDRLMREIGRIDNRKSRGYRLSESAKGRAQLTFFDERWE
jgi:hypothetical protein